MLLRRHQVWLPTPLGWLLLAVVAAGIGWLVAQRAYAWLALEQPARGPDGRGAKLLVVEGWLSPYELDDAARVFRAGRYEQIVTTGGPSDDWPESAVPTTFASRAADYLVRHGVPPERIVALAAPETRVDRTYVSAVQVREWNRRQPRPVVALDVFTGGTHARRSRRLYRMAFGPPVEIGARTARPRDVDPARWWASSAGAKNVVAESLAMSWTVCCFWPSSSAP